MYVDYVRVYQRPGVKDGLTCDPPNRPTLKYINEYVLRRMHLLSNWSLLGNVLVISMRTLTPT